MDERSYRVRFRGAQAGPRAFGPCHAVRRAVAIFRMGGANAYERLLAQDEAHVEVSTFRHAEGLRVPVGRYAVWVEESEVVVRLALRGGDLLRLAEALSEEEVDKMAHALGWPDLPTVARDRVGKVCWANPRRNHFAADWSDGVWSDVLARGLAKRIRAPEPFEQDAWYKVTPLGQVVLRMRLRAAIDARRVCDG